MCEWLETRSEEQLINTAFSDEATFSLGNVNLFLLAGPDHQIGGGGAGGLNGRPLKAKEY